MTKKEVQKRVLQNGKIIDIDKFSSNESGLVLDSDNVCSLTFSNDHYCTFTTGSNINGDKRKVLCCRFIKD